MKAPYRVLYSNDTTNILTCTSPYHPKDAPFRPEMLEGTVDETAGTGVDVHLLQAGLGRVPLWQSRVLPLAEHYAWIKQNYGIDPEGYGAYVLAGGDLLDLFTRRCRLRGLSPFVSMRQNDGHGLQYADSTPDDGSVPGFSGITINRTYREHPKWRLGPDLADWAQHVWNFAIDDVRADRLALIEEQCGYDIDGFELDFMRYPRLFREQETTSTQRADIMAGYVRQARDILDRSARPGQHRWLCARIPAFLAVHDRLGIDVRRWADAGVEMFQLSHYYFTEQHGDHAEIKAALPDAAVYVEMTHTTRVGERSRTHGGYDNFNFRRCTDHQFSTTAHLAYARGLDGVSAFNFVYYRAHGSGERGTFGEPPFHIFRRLADPAWLARQPQHYFVAAVWNAPVTDRPLPRQVGPGESACFSLDMAPPAGGWQGSGRLRLQGSADLGESAWGASLNGVELAASTDRSEPYPSPSSEMLGTSGQHRAWQAPAALLRDGRNEVQVTMLSGVEPAELVFVDLAI